MTAGNRIYDALQEAFGPIRLEVHDESARHAGHSGARPGGGTHFRVVIVSPAFEGKSRLDRHRSVNAALDREFRDGLHALAVTALTPNEDDTTNSCNKN